MKISINPNKESWGAFCLRPSDENKDVEKAVSEIMNAVKENGDEAALDFTRRFDQADLANMKVQSQEFESAAEILSTELANAIKTAAENIRKFHQLQQTDSLSVETCPGVTCMRRSVPIQKVGLYIPGGTAPLFSSLLMLAIPAQLAGCPEIIVCSPPDKSGNIHPNILNTAKYLGIDKIYKIGGAQAIAAMTFGTESIPKVDKIFGPGNAYVTEAKKQANGLGTAIDMPAGPSEVLIIADQTAYPSFLAADLLSQAEHGTDSQVVLVTTSQNIAEKTKEEIKLQLEKLPRKEIAETALSFSHILVVDTLEAAMEFSNIYAPEHLIIATDNNMELAEKVTNAGSVFLGHFSCESAGDYASGTNHTLPTSGFAKAYSGVSLDSFVKKITFQKLTEQGIKNLGPTIETLAAAEGLEAHKNAVSIRLEFLKKQ